MRHLLIVSILLLFCPPMSADDTFYVLNGEQGLKGNHVLQMLQLPDGRIVVMTEMAVNVYDGASFRSVEKDVSPSAIDRYLGYTHLYFDKQNRLWIKDWQQVLCFDFNTFRFLPDCLSVFDDQPVCDLYVDHDGNCWTVNDEGKVAGTDGIVLGKGLEGKTVQDIDTDEYFIYVFTNDGAVNLFNRRTGELDGAYFAYGKPQRDLYQKTSLVVNGYDGRFYQLRMGSHHSIFMVFDTATREWRQLMEETEPFHTLVVTPQRMAYITTPEGYWRYNLLSDEKTRHSTLRLPDGSKLSTGINSVCLDREGGLWLGTYQTGVFYASPLSGVFDTKEREIPLTPVLTAFYLHGRLVEPGGEESDRDAPYVNEIELPHNDNSLAFLFSSMKFVRPRHIFYQYKVNDDGWTMVGPDSVGNRVNESGQFYLSLVGLAPGSYRIAVRASSNPDRWEGKERVLYVRILSPWWQTWWAWLLYALVAGTMLTVSFLIYMRGQKAKNERIRKEESLMLQIHHLIEKCNELENGVSLVLNDREENEETAGQMSGREIEFLDKATRLVEQNLDNPAYNVEQLAKDLCMERTGLYKRLTALMQKSPVTFIRTIRLDRAAALLREKKYSIADIAAQTGFSSPGYFSKCFQRQFGCLPSEYAGGK